MIRKQGARRATHLFSCFLLFSCWPYDLEDGGSTTFRNYSELLPGYTAIRNRNDGASSSVSDVERYAIIMNLLRSASNVILAFVRRWEIQTYLRRNFLPWSCPCKVWRTLFVNFFNRRYAGDVIKLWPANRMQPFWTVNAGSGKKYNSGPVPYQWVKLKNNCLKSVYLNTCAI
jgi:hypothetical protein